ncbi:MAG: hypothetical protein ABI602_01500 [Candidatus Saccharibacteria bacterium]
MSNTYQSPEQSFGRANSSEQAKARLEEVGLARYKLQVAVAALYPSVLYEDARRKATLAMEHSSQLPTLAPETPVTAEAAPKPMLVAPDVRTPEPPIVDGAQAAWLQQLRDQVNEAHQQDQRAA